MSIFANLCCSCCLKCCFFKFYFHDTPVCVCTVVQKSICLCYGSLWSLKQRTQNLDRTHTSDLTLFHRSDIVRVLRAQATQLGWCFGVDHPVHALHVILHSKSCLACVIDGFVGLPVMDWEPDRWVYLSMTPLFQMMMLLWPLAHRQHHHQVGTYNKTHTTF